MAISEEREARFAAYAASVVWIDHPDAGPFVMTPRDPGVRHGVFPSADGATIHVITAHNPGRELSSEANAARHEQLVARVGSLSDVEVWRSVGGDPKFAHSEEGVAVVGLSDAAALELGRRFGQEAIWSWDASSLRLVECEAGSTVTLGWRVEPWVGPPPGS